MSTYWVILCTFIFGNCSQVVHFTGFENTYVNVFVHCLLCCVCHDFSQIFTFLWDKKLWIWLKIAHCKISCWSQWPWYTMSWYFAYFKYKNRRCSNDICSWFYLELLYLYYFEWMLYLYMSLNISILQNAFILIM